MRISFFGAAHEVTGSCSLVETGLYKILIDCGMFQGNPALEAKNNLPLVFNPATLTHVLVTHAHLDHVGRLPLLIKLGYQGFFYATPPTVELAELIMRDALGIMQHESRKTGQPTLYDETHVAAVMERFKPTKYHQPTRLGSMVNKADMLVTFHDAGHIFGSSFIELESEGKRVVFSGDVGNVEVPILKDTDPLPFGLDLLVSESTYGDRLHHTRQGRQQMIQEMVSEAIARGGVLMIPSFSLERTQELIYELNDLVDRKHTLPRVPIFLDSPLAIGALKVYRKYTEYYDDAAKKLVEAGEDLFQFSGLTLTETKDESKRINQVPAPKIIIAGSGMMDGGRIVHHALRYLSDPKSTLLIIGYQSEGTLGRQLVDGARHVEVLGERVQVNCHIKMIGALSAHGDQNKLVSWIGAGRPRRVLLNHGDPRASEALTGRLQAEVGVKATPVQAKMTFEL